MEQQHAGRVPSRRHPGSRKDEGLFGGPLRGNGARRPTAVNRSGADAGNPPGFRFQDARSAAAKAKASSPNPPPSPLSPVQLNHRRRDSTIMPVPRAMIRAVWGGIVVGRTSSCRHLPNPPLPHIRQIRAIFTTSRRGGRSSQRALDLSYAYLHCGGEIALVQSGRRLASLVFGPTRQTDHLAGPVTVTSSETGLWHPTTIV